jgi:hypothetical protein
MRGVLVGEDAEEVGKFGIFPSGKNEGVRRFPDNGEEGR